MPKRPKQHQLEDKSIIKFQLELPENWVFREKNKDYGIDGEVEIFDENGEATGLIFYVQLKATTSTSLTEILSIKFKIDTLKYFKQLEIPVLLVRYSEYQDKIYFKWVNNVDLSFSKKDTKTFNTKMSELQYWKKGTAYLLENDIKIRKRLKSGSFGFPLPYYFDLKETEIRGLSKTLFLLKLRNQLNEYSDYLKYSDDSIGSLIKISISEEVLCVQPGILTEVYFHNLDKRPDQNFIENLSKDILFALATNLMLIGKADLSGKVIFDNNLESQLLVKEELLMYLLPGLLESSYFEKSLLIVKEAFIQDNLIQIFPSIASILLKTKTKSERKLRSIESFFQELLNKAINIGIDQLIANCHYNLGNFYRSQNQYYESIHHYSLAKRFDPKYLNRSYFFSEIAGICFLLGKFKFSSMFYSTSLKLESNNLNMALYSDALLFEGKYIEAKENFVTYIELENEPNEEFHLKYLLIQYVLEEKQINNQKRDFTKAYQLANIKDCNSTSEQKAQLDQAFNSDLLCGLAWYNLGIVNSKEGKYVDATYNFAMSAVINLDDIEAWTNAFLSFINGSVDSNLLLGCLILITAYNHNHDKFLENLYGTVENSTLLNDSETTDILNMIDGILRNSVQLKEEDSVIRLIEENGKISEIQL
ncbi:DUF4365 domain-containing protein [Salegentibacter sp. BLCTC]|uniref:DUF4365 domain-containing protein n=1 Tax=Salegentibacter sp. BLCTC TaxID=2697368 RepID=UPI00187B1200|nr:DUF4365 domain-containing protein [Salegentibacter sp. BLCTC]MBE7639353.1 DUF4365 domain-containing protein [Salegentibacter sp. BLCTC]